jgi:hypothetical protein
MTTEAKLLIGVCLIAWVMVGFAIVATQKSIDYAISKSCAKNKAFQIKGVHYYCVEIEERKK